MAAKLSVVQWAIHKLTESLAPPELSSKEPDGLARVEQIQLTRRQLLKLTGTVGALHVTKPPGNKFFSFPPKQMGGYVDEDWYANYYRVSVFPYNPPFDPREIVINTGGNTHTQIYYEAHQLFRRIDPDAPIRPHYRFNEQGKLLSTEWLAKLPEPPVVNIPAMPTLPKIEIGVEESQVLLYLRESETLYDLPE